MKFKDVDNAASLVTEVDHSPVVRVRIASLAAGDSPRRAGDDPGHARMLAGSHDRLPPIVVHRHTMQVIDGMHRLRAAQLRGEEEIEARFFDGDAADAFVLAVQANVRHGLPLTLSDRKAAADRIIASFPGWSDRAVAAVTGLSGPTVASRRKRLGDKNLHLDTRIGKDGRAYPVDAAQRKAAAARMLIDNPGATLREVARQANLSVETVRRLRADLETDAAAPAGPATADASSPQKTRLTADKRTSNSPVRALVADPAFRATETGRALLRLLSSATALHDRGGELVDSVPEHCLERLASATQACIDEWEGFAAQLERRRLK